MIKRVLHVAWWLGVSLYFGGMVALGAVVAPAVFSTARQAGMTMEGIASPPLDMWKQVGGEIFGVVLERFAWVELASSVLMLLGLMGMILLHRPARRSAWVLFALWVALVAVSGYDGTVLRPTVWTTRTEVRKTAPLHATATQPWPEQDRFDQLHVRSETLGRVKVYLLLGMILVAASRGIAEKPLRRRKVLTPLPKVE